MSDGVSHRIKGARPGTGPRARRGRWRDPTTALIFLLPMLALFIVFRFMPAFGSIGMSLTDYKISGEWSLVGLENYERLISDQVFLDSLKTTAIYTAIYVPLTIVIALATAMLLNSVVWWKGVFRGALFLPYVTSFILAGLVWRWVYEVDGLINGLLAELGAGPIGFLEETALVLPSLAVVSAWKGFGYSMLILMAGLKAIPDSYLEAARVDGASAWQRFWKVILPLLKPVLFFVLVIETIVSFQVFDTIYVMTGGGPARASYTLVYALYDQGFRAFDFGYAATIGVVIFLIVLVITLIQRRFLDREA
ncbi:sugar ABC transporter permease [Actinobacteria bacterium YIM 96077]|uniref:Sugar ABC transporter permease n=1 Tax=Phytoactinopolyspora halophila TaxID=1981511 RepID=A0A329QZY7_9ACTN|nr:sugar ABC transporter permease [Phytoactinopolyspora halophila]AYY11637.1 sugar ABC transporter permease [Actinobacteria bacterium YIM 96077]RAW17930.1 sugar ABC transporter permease [Phytoactinopolyspora halophila]